MQKTLIALGLIGVLAVPALAQGPAIEVTEVAATVGRSDAPFSTISDLVTLPDGRVLVADYETPAVWVWNPETGGVSLVAREGDGPGEVETPMVLARRPGGGFVVYDIGHSAIILYSASFEYEAMHRTRMVSNTKDLLVLGDGSFVVSGGTLSDTHHLQRYGPDGRKLEVWGSLEPGLTDAGMRVNLAGGALRSLPDGSWLFAQSAPYRVVRFESASLANSSVLLEDPDLVPAPTDEALVRREDDRIIYRWWYDHISGVTPLAGDRLLTVVTRFYSGDSVWSVHGPSGQIEARHDH